jgi:hypothetical protein
LKRSGIAKYKTSSSKGWRTGARTSAASSTGTADVTWTSSTWVVWSYANVTVSAAFSTTKGMFGPLGSPPAP